LRGKNEERFRQHVADARRGDLMFLHRFEQGSLGFWRSAVDFIREDEIRENRSAHESESSALRRVREDFGAGDVGGHQVGGELDALKLKVENARDRFHEQRLREAGCSGQQAMSARKEREQQLFNHLALANDDLAQLRRETSAPCMQSFVESFVGGR
jgi:hypothetical protein